MQKVPLGAFCNTFGLYNAIIGLENHFFIILRVAVLNTFFCTVQYVLKINTISRELFFFANNVKRHNCDVKNLQLEHDSSTSVNGTEYFACFAIFLQ